MNDELLESIDPLKNEINLLEQELEEKKNEIMEMEEDIKILSMFLTSEWLISAEM